MAVEPLVVSPGPMVPQPYRVRTRGRETADTWTIELEPLGPAPIDLEPGQFAMLTAYGVGEVPISLSGRGSDGSLIHTIRDVGAVTAELCRTPRDGTIGVRGPFGTTWPLEEARGADVVVLAGGLGLAPLRPAVEGLLSQPDSYGRLLLLYGARTPGDRSTTASHRWRGSRCRMRSRSVVERSRRRGGGRRERRQRLRRGRRSRSAGAGGRRGSAVRCRPPTKSPSQPGRAVAGTGGGSSGRSP